jgi:SAM-dependent methyltransferase
MDINSVEYYDKVASSYSEMINKRKDYLLAIENEIYQIKKVKNYLDIACGDGIRSLRIIKNIKPSKSVLLDESPEMLKHVNMDNDRDSILLVNQDFLNFESNIRFDLITCLWNVFGHLPSRSEKSKFVEKMFSLCEKNGKVYLDINNRYNIRHYGVKNFLKTVFKDAIHLKNRGKFKLKLPNNVMSSVYIHTPWELDKMINSAGFSIDEKAYFDYESGERVQNFWNGQILYKLSKA